MKQEYPNTLSFKEGIIAAMPVVIGYFPVAMAFGLLSRTVQISLADSAMFSIFVFAGASQFMALELLKAGVGAGNIILATFLLNLRHLLMSASLAVRMGNIKKSWLPVLAFGITDESFSVASLKQGKLTAPFMLALNVLPYLAWSGGTITGYLIGATLPLAIQNSLGIGLYALFTALLIPEIKKSLNILYLAVISGLIYAIIFYFKLLPSGWSLVAAIIAASGAGALLLKDGTGEEQA
jgi:4-azaleucine resistance transporter AzlC